MRRRRTSTLVAGALAAMATAIGCRDVLAPTPKDPGTPRLHVAEGPADFRLTGGGRTDQRDHVGFEKNTPESRDFATFGFQARPVGPGTTEGSGNITWVEHNPDALGGGFTFHGRVTRFERTDSDCGQFSGTGRAHLRDGTVLDADFLVEHACDVDEPGRGADHIAMILPGYERHGLLSGGNIQKHRL